MPTDTPDYVLAGREVLVASLPGVRGTQFGDQLLDGDFDETMPELHPYIAGAREMRSRMQPVVEALRGMLDESYQLHTRRDNNPTEAQQKARKALRALNPEPSEAKPPSPAPADAQELMARLRRFYDRAVFRQNVDVEMDEWYAVMDAIAFIERQPAPPDTVALRDALERIASVSAGGPHVDAGEAVLQALAALHRARNIARAALGEGE